MTAALKLYDPQFNPAPQTQPPTISADLTLPDFYAAYYLPIILTSREVAAGTLASYRESLTHWQRLTTDPPLAAIDAALLAQFAARLRTQPGRAAPELSPWTRLKHARQLQAILLAAGPRSSRSPHAANLLPDPPRLPRPRLDQHTPHGTYTHDDLAALLAASQLASRPRGLASGPSLWWQALLTTAYYTGFRRGTLFAFRHNWIEQIDGSHWVNVPAAAAKRRKAQRQYLAPPAYSLIARLHDRHDRHDLLVFPWPNWPRPGAVRWFTRSLAALERLAGLPHQYGRGLSGIRKLHATEVARANPLAAAISLNHASPETTLRHYLDPQLARQAIAQLPPLAIPDTDTRQLRLF